MFHIYKAYLCSIFNVNNIVLTYLKHAWFLKLLSLYLVEEDAGVGLGHL